MVSSAEQLAANFSFSSFSKADDLKKRLWFTLFALIIYRIGTYLPLPGIDAELMRHIAQQNAGGILGIFDKFSGGALGRMTIFALGVMPYISSSIIVQLLTSVSPQLEALKKEGESGRKKLNQYTRYGTVLLAFVQGWGIAAGLESMPQSPVIDPGFFFRFSAVISLLGGTLFLMWLGEQITSRGVGNGISLLIFSGIVANIPHALATTLELGRTGALSSFFIFIILLLVIGLVAFIVFMERAQRRILIQYPKRQVGSRMYGGQSSHLPLKINSSGVIPPIFASSILLLPVTMARFSASNSEGILSNILYYMSPGKPLYMGIFVALIVFFAFFYTAVVFNPVETAENLKKNGAIVPGYRPGQMTADHLDFVLTRLTVVGAIYLSFICVLPEVLISKYSLPFYLGGTSLLIVVSVSIDTVAQIQSHLLAHQYEGLIRKANFMNKDRKK
ncbi:preprotein translocase subunit SecY [Candidatus Nucleicultrix amoebiphila]|jgi:preprotein translocase subunit SecY|uniref:Protein translocase subunit SecY n=1 Tax=Candidatus Nucleicultrix amoebiphila FS5 TaxID=1414854 RepID=A0A1W6N6D9_9PROT|nr:preprotein translocase subunit SecY [Candidatus Nucleicultrix amoebiphila]ARN85342.1 preprotein translocase subunit SecY [Candidatus Nucleicultrix amoebiphila FS5]